MSSEGGFLLEYGTQRTRFRLMPDKAILRQINGVWVPLYRSDDQLPKLIHSIRESKHMVVYEDHAGGENGNGGRRSRPRRLSRPASAVVQTRRKEAIAMAEEKPLREGAKYRALLDRLPLNKTDKKKLVADAEKIARDRGDGIVRDYYLYLASDMDMPDETKRRWDFFRKEGKELTGSAKAVAPTKNGSKKTAPRKRTSGQNRSKTKGKATGENPKTEPTEEEKKIQEAPPTSPEPSDQPSTPSVETPGSKEAESETEPQTL